MREKSDICHQIYNVLAKEFQRKKLLFSHEPQEDFYKSQWQSKKKSLIWVIYRWILAIVFIAGVVSSCLEKFAYGKWFIYLTDWGLTLCMYTCIFGAVLATIFYFDKEKAVGSWVLKMYWCSYWTTLVIATVVTLIYWSFIYPTRNNNSSGLFVINLWSHAFNSILMTLDHMFVAFPARLLHFIYPLGLGIIYALFTIIYYYSGGVDWYGSVAIYPILDWSTRGCAILTTLGCFLLSLIFGFLHFGLYKLRMFIYCKRRNSSTLLNV